MTTFRDAFDTAVAAGAAYVKTTPEGHWYPCGFANLIAPKVRKNSAMGKELLAAGFRWEEYGKRFSFSPYVFTNTQSMDYKADILREVQKVLEEKGFTGFFVETRMD